LTDQDLESKAVQDLRVQQERLQQASDWAEAHRTFLLLYCTHAVTREGIQRLRLDDVPSLQEHYAVLTKFETKTLAERRAWVCSQFEGPENDLYLKNHFETAVTVSLFCAYHGARPHWVYQQEKTLSKRGLPHNGRVPQAIQDKTVQCAAWIHYFVKKIGERLPELENEDGKTIEVPVRNRARLYMLYRTRKFGVVIELVCRGTFYRVVEYPEFAFIRYPSRKKAFYHKCADCVEFDGTLQVAKTTLEIAKARNAYTQHLLLMMKERELYARIKLMAASTTLDAIFDDHADSSMSLIIDAMDQVAMLHPSLIY